MMTTPAQDAASLAADCRRTDIIDIEPGRIRVHGYPIRELIGQTGFAEMIWLVLHDGLPAKRQAILMKAALMTSAGHGPYTPSIAVAEIVASCGLPLSGTMASALNTLDDVRGGAGRQAVGLFHDIEVRMFDSASLEAATAAGVDTSVAAHGRYLPGSRYRFHPVDSRAGRLLAPVDGTTQDGVVGKQYIAIGRVIEALLSGRKGESTPMNIDDTTAVIYAELNFAASFARGVLCFSRAVGVLAHTWEQSDRGERNKGPMSCQLPYHYIGHATWRLTQAEPAPTS